MPFLLLPASVAVRVFTPQLVGAGRDLPSAPGSALLDPAQLGRLWQRAGSVTVGPNRRPCQKLPLAAAARLPAAGFLGAAHVRPVAEPPEPRARPTRPRSALGADPLTQSPRALLHTPRSLTHTRPVHTHIHTVHRHTCWTARHTPEMGAVGGWFISSLSKSSLSKLKGRNYRNSGTVFIICSPSDIRLRSVNSTQMFVGLETTVSQRVKPCGN